MRARYPDESGYVVRDGVRVHWEVYGSGEPTVLLLPTWSIIHSRHWKMQIPYLARHCRVLTFDGRGNGRSDRPASGYDEREFADDALAVHGRDRHRARRARLALAGRAVGPAARRRAPGARRRRRLHLPLGVARRALAGRRLYPWNDELDTDEGWAKYNRHYWLRDYRGLPRVLLRRDVHGAALDQADRGLRRLGARDDAETCSSRRDAGRASTSRRLASSLRASRCPCW